MQSHRTRTSPVMAAFADNRAIISPSVYRVFTESVPLAVPSRLRDYEKKSSVYPPIRLHDLFRLGLANSLANLRRVGPESGQTRRPEEERREKKRAG